MRNINNEGLGLSHFFEDPVAELASIRKTWGWFLAEGFGLIVLGLFAISTSIVATFLSVAMLGWILFIGGVVHVVHAFSARRNRKGVIAGLFTGVLYAVAGILIIRSPGATALMLTFLLAPLFIVGGIIRIIMAASVRYPQWGWSAVSGILSVVLGVLIWGQWPASGLWFIGMMVGIEMFFAGISTSAFAFALKAIPPMEHTTKVAA